MGERRGGIKESQPEKTKFLLVWDSGDLAEEVLMKSWCPRTLWCENNNEGASSTFQRRGKEGGTWVGLKGRPSLVWLFLSLLVPWPPLKPGDESLVLVASGPPRGKSCLDPHLGLTRVPYCAFQHHGEIAPPGMNTVQDFLDQVYRASSLEGVDSRLVSLWLISMSEVMWILWNTRLYRRLWYRLMILSILHFIENGIL